MAPEVGRAAADAGARAVGGVVRVRAARRRIAEKRGRLPQGAPLDRGAAAEAVTARGAGGRDAYQRDCDLYSGVNCAISFTFCLLLDVVLVFAWAYFAFGTLLLVFVLPSPFGPFCFYICVLCLCLGSLLLFAYALAPWCALFFVCCVFCFWSLAHNS